MLTALCLTAFLAAGAQEKAEGKVSRQLQKWLSLDPDTRNELAAQPFATKAISEDDAEEAAELFWAERGKRMDETYKKMGRANAQKRRLPHAIRIVYPFSACLL